MRDGARASQAAAVALSAARLALGLLTVLPSGAAVAEADRRPRGGALSAAAGWFPAVGALVGLALGAVRYLAAPTLGAAVASVLAVIVLVALTGALHQDGLADLADALGVRGGRPRRLEVMRSSTLGAFGVLALVLWALLMVAVLAALPRERVLATGVIACAAARWAAVLHAMLLAPARADGLGRAFAPGPSALGAASALALATLALWPVGALCALVGAALTAGATARLSARLLGGRTGDTLGATVALAEALAALILLALAR